MTTSAATSGNETYTKAVVRGDYDLYVGNLFGKYDDVRVYWEDQITRIALRPFIARLVNTIRRQGRKVRILDLGCGSGQGVDLLTKIDKRDLDLSLRRDRVLSESDLELYLGLDLSEAMVEKGNQLFEEKPNVRFRQADLRRGLEAIKGEEPPFDIYFSSYGSLSHLSKADLKSLLKDICSHGSDGSLIVMDLLGRNSIEWPDYWLIDPDEEDEFQSYSMSYLNSEFELKSEVERFPIRYWTGLEVDQLVNEIEGESNSKLEIMGKFDRSIMVGRHVDTGEFNPELKPIRRMVNRLHEDYMRTDLQRLIIDRKTFPKHPNPEIHRFLVSLVNDWNLLVKFCSRRLKGNISTVEAKRWSSYSSPLQFAMMTIDRVVNDTGWMWNGDPRANIIEPQLGYALRSLEYSHQSGMGCGHGLIAVLKIKR